jgi:hypothetical protein
VPSEDAQLRSSRQNIVDGRVVSCDVLCGAHPQYSIDCCPTEHLSEGTSNAP